MNETFTQPYSGQHQCPECGSHWFYSELKFPEQMMSLTSPSRPTTRVEMNAKGVKSTDKCCPSCLFPIVQKES